VGRFRRYLEALTGGTDDVVLPIGVANPMAREHAVARLDELLALGAEEVGAQAAAEADARLRSQPGTIEIKAALVLADDLGGGWTNRYTTEASVRFPGRGALKRPFATALVWTSEPTPTAEVIRQEVLAAIYRVAYQQCHGLPTTLQAMLDQEGLAAVFADTRPALGPAELERVRRIIGPRIEGASYPTAFACLYGDEAAEQLGYPRLGLPPRAGFLMALADALDHGHDPLAALAGPG
jgi:hypothetical protein